MKTNLAIAIPPRHGTRSPVRATPHDVDLVVQMAHDLRSPLSGILMLTELLQKGVGGPVTETQRRQLGLIYSAALSLCSNASDVVELARDGRSLADGRHEAFRVSDVLASVRDMVLPIAVEKGLELRIVPPAHDYREGCARALSRVLLNLTTNALKYTDHGFVEIAVREVSGSPDRVEFSVLDSGPGLRPDTLRLVDEPARDRVCARKHLLTSSGLGLTICRRLVRTMSSVLRVESAPREGTRFSFELYIPRV